MVAVYDSPDCGAPTETIKIVGFAVIRITNVTFGPPPLIDAVIKCNIIKSDIRGSGGAPYGPLGAIPNLVE